MKNQQRSFSKYLMAKAYSKSDFEKLKKTFAEIGQEYSTSTTGEFCSSSQLQYDQVIKIDSGCGYAGFVCEFYFLNGKRVGYGVWE